MTLTWEECDVVQLCNQVVASVSFSRRSDNQFLFNTSFESFRMETDVQRMQQVIINLMSNADKFTKHQPDVGHFHHAGGGCLFGDGHGMRYSEGETGVGVRAF